METRGFTLIEALVAIAIVAILAALILAVLAKAIPYAKRLKERAEWRDKTIGNYADIVNMPRHPNNGWFDHYAAVNFWPWDDD
jgi:prepilin-type N-terminal cleavage/methylation domain-containing protein